ncbi:MAG TPA: hypothetical protein ENJ95_12610 [Bacteroidetes bacterium]|nr:hypothetical protein [Bacteroidota bacterium]
MKKEHFKQAVLTLLMVSGLMATNSFATDGYFSLGYGAMSKGMGGVGVSMYHVSLINGNPAGLAMLGNQYSIGVAVFNPNRQYTITGNPSPPPAFGLASGTIESDSKFFVIPNLGANWAFGANDENAFGVAIYGNGGMNTDYPTQTFYDQSEKTTGVNLAQLFASFSYSRTFAEKHGLGISAIVAYQLFEAKGLASFGGFSRDSTKLSSNGTDNSIGFGIKVGYMGEIAEGLHIGASYQSKMAMGEFSDYAGLFAEKGGFDIPATWTAGVSYDVSDMLTVAFDVKQILYSGVKSIANPIDPMALPPAFPDGMGGFIPNPNQVPLGSDKGSGFGWEDMTVFKIGLEVSPNEDWTFRGGFSHGAQPIPKSEVLFNILAPGVIEDHITLGFSKSMGDSGNQLHFSFNYALNSKVSGTNPFDPGQTIDLEMNQIDVEVGYTF